MAHPVSRLADGVVLVEDGDQTMVVSATATFRLPATPERIRRAVAEREGGLYDDLSAAGVLAGVDPSDPPPALIRVLGGGTLALAVGRALLRGGHRLILWDNEPPLPQLYPATLQATGALALQRLLLRERPDARIRVVNHWSKPDDREPLLTVLASGYLEIDRAITDALLRLGQPHLPVRPCGSGVVVGPLVLPGRSPCVRCGDLARSATLPQWPRVLHVLSRTRLDPGPPWSEWAAGHVLLALDALQRGQPDDLLGSSIEISGPGAGIGVRQWSAHPECGCGAAGS